MITKGWIYHIVMIMDVEFETPYLESVHVVREFLKVFPNNLLEIPSEQ